MDNTATWIKVLVIGVGISVVIALFVILKWQHDTIVIQQEAIEDFKRLGDGIIRSQAQYVSKDDLNGLAKDLKLNIDLIRQDLNNLDGEVAGINYIVSSTHGYKGQDLSSTSTKPNTDPSIPSIDQYGYLKNSQLFSVNEPFGKNFVPFGSVEFKAWKENPWNVEVYPRNYSVVTIFGQDENGKHYAYNKFFIETQGKQYVIPVQQAKFKEELPDSKFYFSPRLYLGLDAGAIVSPPKPEVMPNLQLSLFSYGRTKVDPDWSFLGVGIGYGAESHRAEFVMSPINYNVGHNIPFTSNLHIGPTISLDVFGGVGVFGGMRVGL